MVELKQDRIARNNHRGEKDLVFLAKGKYNLVRIIPKLGWLIITDPMSKRYSVIRFNQGRMV